MNTPKFSILIFSSVFILSSCSSQKITSQTVGNGIGGALILGGLATYPKEEDKKNKEYDNDRKKSYGLIAGGIATYYIMDYLKKAKIKEGERIAEAKRIERERIAEAKRVERERIAKKRNKILENKYNSIFNKIKKIKGEKGVRYLLFVRSNIIPFNEKSDFDEFLRYKGINYLEKLYITNKNIILTSKVLKDSTDLWVVYYDKYLIFGSFAEKGTLLYENRDKYIGLSSLREITDDIEVNIDEEKSINKVVYGSLESQAKELNVKESSLLVKATTTQLGQRIPRSKKLFILNEFSEFDGNLVDYIKDNPITSLAVAAGVTWYLSDNSKGSVPNKCESPTRTYAYASCAFVIKGCDLAKSKIAPSDEKSQAIANGICAVIESNFISNRNPTFEDIVKSEAERQIGKLDKSIELGLLVKNIAKCGAEVRKKVKICN